MARGAKTATKQAAKGGGGGGAEPNLYRLSGHGVHVTYSTSSFAGPPQFAYNDQHFTGNEIQTTKTDIGELVTVTLSVVPDLQTITFTLVIPEVVLGQSSTEHIETIGITTVHRDSIIGPPQGQDEVYTVHKLRGTAQIVKF